MSEDTDHLAQGLGYLGTGCLDDIWSGVGHILADIAQSLRILSKRTPGPHEFDPEVIRQVQRSLEHLQHEYEIEVEMPEPQDG
jgi:hypothetical protein